MEMILAYTSSFSKVIILRKKLQIPRYMQTANVLSSQGDYVIDLHPNSRGLLVCFDYFFLVRP